MRRSNLAIDRAAAELDRLCKVRQLLSVTQVDRVGSYFVRMTFISSGDA